MESERVANLIIGAGPAGLAVAAQLRERGLPFVLLERAAAVGAAWRGHYDRLHLHTVKEYSHLPGLPFPADYPRYVSRQQLIDYFEAYARKYEIMPRYDREVKRIERSGSHWQVSCTNGETYWAEQVVLTTGVNRIPYRPPLAEQEDFGGRILHSSEYRNAAPFAGQRVAVVGMGNSGAEIALDLSQAGITTYLSVRGPINIVPRELFGRPAQLSALMLARLPHWLSDRLALAMRHLAVGNLRPYGLELSREAPSQQLRQSGKTPVIDIGTLEQIKAGKIRVLPAIDHFTPSGIVVESGDEIHLDAVILATGYRARLDRLIPDIAPWLDAQGLPRGISGQGALEGLHFVGFDNYTAGGTLAVIHRDAQRVAAAIARPGQPDPPTH